MTRANDRSWSPPQRGERRHPLPGGPVRTTPPTVCTGCFRELQALETVEIHHTSRGYRWHHVDDIEVPADELHRPIPAASQDTLRALVQAAVEQRREEAAS